MTYIRLESINNKLTNAIINRTPRNCCGRQTIKVYNAVIEYINDLTGEIMKANKGYFLFHYGSPIVCYDKTKDVYIFDYSYYDYSQSTSNVRNRFYEFCSSEFDKLNTKDLRKIERQELRIDNFYGKTVRIAMQITKREYFSLNVNSLIEKFTNYYILDDNELYN